MGILQHLKICISQNLILIISKAKKTNHMKILKVFYCLLLLPIPLYSQDFSIEGNYSFKSPHYYESIDLFENGTFSYWQKTEFLKIGVTGNWQIRNDSLLVLDSKPQRTKLVVWESKKKGKETTLHIRDMENNSINYSLYLISNKGDTLEFKDQFNKTVTEKKFASFYIVDSKGLHSPLYIIRGTNSNFFEVHFETHRVFENEYWILKKQGIIPMGIDNRYSNHQLSK